MKRVSTGSSEQRTNTADFRTSESQAPPRDLSHRLPGVAGRTLHLWQTLQGGSAVANCTRRKLDAILAANVVGYSPLTRGNEEGTHRALCAYVDDITALIDRHNVKVTHFAAEDVLANEAIQ